MLKFKAKRHKEPNHWVYIETADSLESIKEDIIPSTICNYIGKLLALDGIELYDNDILLNRETGDFIVMNPETFWEVLLTLSLYKKKGYAYVGNLIDAHKLRFSLRAKSPDHSDWVYGVRLSANRKQLILSDEVRYNIYPATVSKYLHSVYGISGESFAVYEDDVLIDAKTHLEIFAENSTPIKSIRYILTGNKRVDPIIKEIDKAKQLAESVSCTAEEQKVDTSGKPSYYTNKGKYEPFKLFRKYQLTDYYICSILAYLARPDKPNNERLSDYRKAVVFAKEAMSIGEGSYDFPCSDEYREFMCSEAQAIAECWKIPLPELFKPFLEALLSGNMKRVIHILENCLIPDLPTDDTPFGCFAMAGN